MKARPAMLINQRFFKLREPIRRAAAKTITTMAGLMPKRMPAITGRSPKER